MYPQGLMSMYQTAGGQGLFWELKVAAQESQKLFLPEIEEHLITPLWVLLPAAGGHHTGHTVGRREKEQEEHRSVILTILPIQIFRGLQINC